jgi:2-keto-4-pentenoate hydratase/2-oxohepta-3-ene-1,7-dioic acid hydratase in catechol pathway
MAQEVPGVDYECELVAVMGKQCKDVSEADALSYVLGYTVGDDVSHREWQLKRGGGQWSHGEYYPYPVAVPGCTIRQYRSFREQIFGLTWQPGKGQDTWAPMGPGIVTTDLIKDPQELKLKTKLNGKVVQVGGLQY